VPAVGLEDLAVTADDVVVLATKSQDTGPVLMHLADVAPESTPIVCAQNGVANEPAALRWFECVHGAVVNCPALHLRAGEVSAYALPPIGVVDVGRWPSGTDEVDRAVADDLRRAGFASRAVPDISAWKHAKLLTNLENAVSVVCDPQSLEGTLLGRLQDEARGVLAAHGIEVIADAEYAARLDGLLRIGRIDGPRPGGSTWQSVTRGLRVTETDYLCGEIVRLGRVRGLPAPVSELMQRLARRVALGLAPVRGLEERDVLARL
jgi:2-dehydropantoate 2-reductase